MGEEPTDDEIRATYRAQRKNLGLRPWQEPPRLADSDDPDERDKVAQALLRRMLAAGISRWEHDPLRTLREREQ